MNNSTVVIKRNDGSVLFKHKCKNNTPLITLQEYIKRKKEEEYIDLSDINLSYTDLEGIDLSNVNLYNANLSGVNLSHANLNDTNLRRANLRYAILQSTTLQFAVLSETDLSDANLNKAILKDVNLSNANLSGANLSGANLSGADLNKADLRYVNLGDADLKGANLHNVYFNENTTFLTIQCPSHGSFIGWKIINNKIIKLLIPEDAKRSSATSAKCRCSKAKVLAIESLEGLKLELKSIKSEYDEKFVYVVGDTVEVKDFDENRWNECSTGIHFFMSREMAIQYR